MALICLTATRPKRLLGSVACEEQYRRRDHRDQFAAVTVGAERQMSNEEIDYQEIMRSFHITKLRGRTSSGGAWARGTIVGYRFGALVFSEPALNRAWEVNGDSRISKLWICDDSRRTVYNWDRGADVPAANATVEAIVELFAEGLADTVFDALADRRGGTSR